MKIQQVDDTPIKNIEEDWGNPDGTGKKAKTLGQVQKFIKAKINEIENKTVRIEKSNEEFESKIINQIENYKPIEINGNVNNAADEEDLSAKNGLIKIADRGTLYGKGYKILRIGVDLQSQFNQENTIYEIRYDFDLNGDTLNIPAGCTLKFEGGSFRDGTINGDFIVKNLPEYQNLYIFPKGFNFVDNISIYSASDIGMIADDPNASAHNKAILARVLAKKKGINLNKSYYIDNGNVLDYVINVSGGEIITTTGFFILESGGGIKALSTTFTGSSGYLIDNRSYIGDAKYLVEELSFENCVFNKIVVCYLTWADNDYSSPEWGINRLRAFNCTFNKPYSWLFCVCNCVITEECSFNNNRVFGLSESCLYLGYNNDYNHDESLRQYFTDVIVENNTIEGKVSANATYLTPILVDSHVNKLYYRNNIVKNLINTNKGWASYDCYGSCQEYYCENNSFSNIVAISENGYSEIFKSKAGGKLRRAVNNTWSINYDECRRLCKEQGITFTDEEFENLNSIGIFHFTGKIEDVYFANNKINITGGKLKLTQWDNTSVRNLLFDNNNISTTSIIPDGKLFPQSSTYGVSGIFTNNVLHSDGAETFAFYRYLFSAYSNPNYHLVIKGNRYNGAVSLGTGDIACAEIKDNNFALSPNFTTCTLDDCRESSYVEISGAYKFSAIGLTIKPLVNTKYLIKIHVAADELNLNKALLFKIGEFTGVMTLVDANVSKKLYLKEGAVFDEWDNEIVVNQYSNIYKGDSVSLARWNDTTIALQYFKKPEVTLIFESGQPPVLNATTKGTFRFTSGKPTWWNGSSWVDANGEVVS